MLIALDPGRLFTSITKNLAWYGDIFQDHGVEHETIIRGVSESWMITLHSDTQQSYRRDQTEPTYRYRESSSQQVSSRIR